MVKEGSWRNRGRDVRRKMGRDSDWTSPQDVQVADARHGAALSTQRSVTTRLPLLNAILLPASSTSVCFRLRLSQVCSSAFVHG